jgi:hypothetical protein
MMRSTLLITPLGRSGSISVNCAELAVIAIGFPKVNNPGYFFFADFMVFVGVCAIIDW